MVYVLNVFGQPLMPTEDHRKVRLLLKEGKAVVVKNSPFTIRLKVRTKQYVQPVTLGVDAEVELGRIEGELKQKLLEIKG